MTGKKFFLTSSIALVVIAASITAGASIAAARSKMDAEFGDLFNENAIMSVPNSKEWDDTLKRHTVRLWADAQFLDKIVLNARARLELTWLPKSLLKNLDKDRRVNDWVQQGLNAYYSNDKKIKSKLKGRDVFALNFKAEKTWSFDPSEMKLQYPDGKIYQVTADDFLWKPDFDLLTDIPSGTMGTLYMLLPSVKAKAGSKIKVTLGPDSADFEVPKK